MRNSTGTSSQRTDQRSHPLTAGFRSDVPHGPGRRVVFSTYASSRKIAEATACLPSFRFDLAVCDEAHWCAGLQRGAYKAILDDALIPARKRLFFTATPEVYRPQDVEFLRRKHVALASMSDRDLFGRVLHRLSLADAIAQKLLCPYQVVFMPVTNDEVERLIDERTQVTPDRGDTRTDAYSLATQIACVRAMRTYGCRRMVSFHPRIDHSRAFSAHFGRAVELLPASERPAAEVAAAHVDGGGMAHAMRRRLLKQFATLDDTHRLLSNVKLLSEGFDMPGIDAIVVIGTQRNQTQIIQMIGRAVRPMEGKKVGTIVLPVLVRGTESVNDAISRSEHKPIVKLLAALRSADPELERSLDHLRIEVGTDGRAIPARRRFVLDVAREVDAQFAKAIQVMLIETLAPSQRAAAARAERTPTRGALAPVIKIDADGPMDRMLISRGLEVLEDYAQQQLTTAPHEHTVHDSFPIGRWWWRLLDGWSVASLEPESAQRIADAVTWLSLDPQKHAGPRAQLIRLTKASLVEHIHTYVAGWDVRGSLGDLARTNVIGPCSDLDTERICAALTAQAVLSPARRAELVCDALHDAGWEACRRDPHAKTFIDGFLDGLEGHLHACPNDATPAESESDDPAGHYAAGWHQAGAFLESVLVPSSGAVSVL